MLRRRSRAEPAAAPAAPDGYDEVVYPGAAFPQTHPDRLATLATLFGGRPRPAEHCRVLELGCGDGANLIAIAYALPGAELVGIDLNAAAIARGRETIAALGLTNARLQAGDIAALDAGALGRFDHVIAHGVYSWVPEHVREALLALCRGCLEREGTAFVSFNALPGWHLRGLLRAALLEQVGEIADPGARVAAARALLRRLKQNKRYDGALGREVERMLGAADALIYHDVLAPVNEPFSIAGFTAAARAAGLRFLCDADLHQGAQGAAGDELGDSGGGLIARESELDVLTARMFRQAVLVRDDAHAGPAPRADAVPRLRVAGDLRPPRDVRLSGRAIDEFRAEGGGSLRIDHPLVKAALVELAGAWPRSLGFDALAEAAAVRVRSPRDDATLAAALLESFRRHAIDLHVWEPDAAWKPGERPAASALARLQCGTGEEVVSLRGETVRLEDGRSRRLLMLLDGTRDSAALAGAMSLDQRAARELPQQLARFARLGLLER